MVAPVVKPLGAVLRPVVNPTNSIKRPFSVGEFEIDLWKFRLAGRDLPGDELQV